MVTRDRLAVIPARGGSKRLPRKNIMPFHGKPLIAWSIEAALSCGLFDRVLVSTDDKEIAEVAVRYGASVPFLRRSFSDDQSPVSLATISALEQIEFELNETYSVVVQLMANCPMRTESDIRAGITNFERSGAPSQISCFRFGWMNPWWACRLDDVGQPDLLFPETINVRSQDLPKLFCPTGALWAAQTSALRSARTFHMPGRVFFEMPWDSAVDIDDIDDFRMAEAVFLMRNSKK
jgi:CMP-N-acetylneuraminic acid synthetase